MAPADELRQAARHIRDIAAKATPGPWLNLGDGDRIIRDPDATAREDDSDPCGEGPPLEYVVDEPLFANPANGDHFVLWDPPTVLLVADLLDDEATEMESMAERSIYGQAGVGFVYEYAGEPAPVIKLARSINTKLAAVTAETPEATDERS